MDPAVELEEEIEVACDEVEMPAEVEIAEVETEEEEVEPDEEMLLSCELLEPGQHVVLGVATDYYNKCWLHNLAAKRCN